MTSFGRKRTAGGGTLGSEKLAEVDHLWNSGVLEFRLTTRQYNENAQRIVSTANSCYSSSFSDSLGEIFTKKHQSLYEMGFRIVWLSASIKRWVIDMGKRFPMFRACFYQNLLEMTWM